MVIKAFRVLMLFTSQIHFSAANSEKIFYQGKALSSYVNAMTAAMLLNKLCLELSLF